MVSIVRRPAFAALVLVTAALLSGCSGQSVRSLIPGNVTPAEEAKLRQQFAVVAICPNVLVRDGTNVLTSYERGKDGDPKALRYQATITDTARECHTNPADGNTAIKVGIGGHFILGPTGTPASATLPLRVVVLRDGSEVLYSQLFKIPASATPTDANTLWTQVVDGISIPPDKTSGAVQILIGFDESGK